MSLMLGDLVYAELDTSHPMVQIDEPGKRGHTYDCPRCGFVEVHEGLIAPGHEICLACYNGKDHVMVNLVYLGEYFPPTLVWEGDYV